MLIMDFLISLDMLTLQRKALLLGPISHVPTSIDNMNPNNRFIVSLSAIPIADGVIAHSIVGVKVGGAGGGRRRRREIFERTYRRRRIGKDCELGTFDAG